MVTIKEIINDLKKFSDDSLVIVSDEEGKIIHNAVLSVIEGTQKGVKRFE